MRWANTDYLVLQLRTSKTYRYACLVRLVRSMALRLPLLHINSVAVPSFGFSRVIPRIGINESQGMTRINRRPDLSNTICVPRQITSHKSNQPQRVRARLGLAMFRRKLPPYWNTTT